ncbi:MAG: hypothetical protein JSU82_11110 [Rhodospirillales bacterium]|nr:MAG: hypothetical protein JSU82_11110 [Rhodospirillales bacterium]
MAELFTDRYALFWVLALALALFLPVRNLIWVLMVRRAMSKAEIDAAEQQRLRRRAGISAGLLVFVFAWFFVNAVMFRG